MQKELIYDSNAGSGLPETVVANLPQILEQGPMGLYELRLPENELTIHGKALLQAVYGIEAESTAFGWDAYIKQQCHPDDCDSVREKVDTVLQKPGGYNVHYRVRNGQTGEWRWVYVFGSIVVDGGGEKRNIHGGLLDITQHMNQLELMEEQRQIDERTAIMLDATPLACMLIDEQYGIIDCNKAAVELSGFSSKEELLRRYVEVFPEFQPDGSRSLDKILQMRKKAFKTGRAKFRWHYQLPTGEDLPVDTEMQRVEWRGGYRVVSFSHDLRKIEAANAQAQEAEERTLLMLNEAPMACYFLDEQGNIVDCNAETLRMLGAESVEDFGYLFSSFNPEYQPDGRRSVDAAQAFFRLDVDEDQHEFEWTHRHRDGHEIPCAVTARHVKWKGKRCLIAYERDLSDVQAAEWEAKAAEERTKTMLDLNPLISSLWTVDGTLIDCNQEALRVLGVKDKDEYARGFSSFLNPEFQPDGETSAQKGQRLRTKAFETGWEQFEWLYLTASGEPLPVETTLIRVDSKDGYQLVAYSRDLRDIHEHQKKAREAEERINVMVNEMPMACYFIDDKHEIIDWNDQAERMLGVEGPEDLAGVLANYDPEFQPNGRRSDEMTAEVIEKAFREGNLSLDWVHVLKDGRELYVEITLRRIKWSDGYRLLFYERDISKIREAEKVVKAAEERNKIMLDATPLCANFWDEDINLIDCNQESAHLFELPSKEAYLSHFHELSPEFQPNGRRSAEAAMEMLKTAFREGRCVFEWMHRKLGGEMIPSEITLVRVKYGQSNVVIGYTRDLRELKAKMAEIERTHDELVMARDLAESSMRAKSAFLANMSHEIRTPITAITGMTDIAKKSGDPEKMKYCLDKVSDASSHLLGVVNDILDISQIEAGRFVLSSSDFALEHMLTRITDVMTFRIDQKQQAFMIKVDKDVPHAIVTDQQRLSQIIVNLLSNANKFTPEKGQVTLNIELEEAESNGWGCVLRFTVTDNGIGIEPESVDKLFASFEQGDNSISRRFGGTGLGLAISKAIVEQLGGEIGVKSTPGQGSVFSFTIRTRRGVASAISRLDPNIDLKDVSILVVDDMPMVLEYFADIAAGIGASFRTAESAGEAMLLLAEKPANIIFIDWLMPEMDGIELTRQIRRQYGDNIIVIMISAMEWAQIESDALAAGVNRFIAKPLLPSPIIDCINECFGNGALQNRPEDTADSFEGIFEGKRILLAEDVDINREIVAAILEDTDVEITCAENGLDACNLFSSDPKSYDLILMDIHMPEVDGYEATRRIRSMPYPSAKTVPIVAMTANVFKEDVERCLAAGMNAHVPKPIDINVLIQTLSKYLC